MCRSKAQGGRRCSGKGVRSIPVPVSTESEGVNMDITVDDLKEMSEKDRLHIVLNPNSYSQGVYNANARLLLVSKNETERYWVGEKATPEALTALARDEEQHIRKRVASLPNIPQEAQLSLSQDKDKDVRSTLAFNPNISADVALRLAKDRSRVVYESLVKNYNAPPLALAHLANSRTQSVKFRVAEHPNTPVSVLVNFVNNPDEWLVRDTAKRHPTYVALREQVAKDLDISPDLPQEWREQLIDAEIGERYPQK